MKKLIMGLAVAAVALFATSSIASANFVQASGTSASAGGTVNFAGNILTASCSMSLSGRVASATTLSVTSGSGSCNVGGLTLSGFPWTQTIDLAGNWTISHIVATVAVPLFGNCVYEGTLGGTYESDGEGVTILTITDSASDVTKTSGSVACTSTPTISGELEINVGIA
ncbi:MAG TPA: hypothetical protein VI072_35825 [Polyangiaceae bacterium]